MSSIKLSPNASGTGALTIAAPNTNTDVTFNLGTALGNNGASALVSTDNAGNLGLGVTPSAWASTSRALQLGAIGFLENNGNTSQYVGRNGFRGTGGGWIYSTSSVAQLYGMEPDGGFKWYTAPSGTAGNAISFTQAMTLTAGGNLGIGATAPAFRCVIQDSAGETILGLNNTSSGGRHYLLISGGSSGSYAGGRFGLYSVTNGIDLLAATTSTGSTAGGTSGNGVGFSNAGVWFDRGWADYPSITVCNNNYNGNTNQSQLRIHGTNATWYSYPNASGADFACSLFIDGTYQTSSDGRYKTNVTDIDNALAKVLSISGKRFQTINRIGEIETGSTQNGYRFGFIAQDLQAAGLDELYKHNIEEDDGTDGYNKAYSVEYDAVVPLLVNAIKELKAEFDAYKATHP